MDRFVPAWVALALLALGAGSGPVAAGETEYVQPSASAHTFLTTPASRRAYRQRAWAREQGLPDNCVLSLLQTRDGCVWVGTRKGLARFDGFQFTRINGAYAGAFASDQCTALAEGDDGTLWVGTDQGLIRLDGEGARRFDRADGLVSDSILALCHARNGDLWIGTAMGLHRRRGGRFESIPMASGRPVVQAWDLEIRALAEDAAGAVWFASRERVRRWEPQTDSIRDVTLPAGDSQFAMQITTDVRTNVWLRGALVLRCLPDRTIVPLSDRLLVRSSDPAEGRENVSALLADRAGNLWLGWEESGLTCYRDGRITEFGARDGLSDDAVNCLMEDREENLWIGTRAGGLNCWQPRRFTVYTAGDGLPDNDTRTVCPARGGGVWIGTERGLSRLREDRFVRDPLPARLVDARVRSLHELADGTLWIGTMDSLERWQDGVLLPFRWVEASDANRVRVVTTDRAGTLWVGRNAGLLRWVGGAWTGFSRPDGLPHEDVRAVLEDRAGRLWIGTHGGGLCVAAATPTFRSLLTLTTTNGLTGNRVWVLHQDANGVVWAGTDAGLTRIDPGLPSPAALAVPLRVSRFDRTQGLVDGPVNALVEDDQGRFWIGCDRGIYHVSRADLDDVAMGRASRVVCITYDEADGLLTGEISGQRSQPAACRTPDGDLWFTTAQGLVRFDPARVVAAEVPPPVRIDLVAVDDLNRLRLTDPGGTRGVRPPVVPRLQSLDRAAMKSRAGSGLIEIHYTAPTFVASHSVRFRYRLEGWDVDWIDAGPDRVAHYANLPPGAYRFRVCAASRSGLWNEVGAVLGFAVSVPFGEQWWFWPACAVLAAGVAGWGFRWWHLQRAQALAFDQERALARERDRLARDIHDDLGAGLTRLALLGERIVRECSEPAVRASAGRLVTESAGLIDNLGDLVWATDRKHDRLPDLIAFLREHAAVFLADAGVPADIEFPAVAPDRAVRGLLRRTVHFALKEALSNAVRHAKAKRVVVQARLRGSAGDPGRAEAAEWLEIRVEDDGCGFDISRLAVSFSTGPTAGAIPAMHRPTGLDLSETAAADAATGKGRVGCQGRGLAGLQARLSECGGSLAVRSEVGRGTTLVLSVPL